MMLYRDYYYNPDSEVSNKLEVNIIKHRNGAIGRVSIHFDRKRMQFADLSLDQRNDFHEDFNFLSSPLLRKKGWK